MTKFVNESERCQQKAYWTHFKDQKFVRVFKPEYEYRLLIPQKFTGSLSGSFDGLVKVRDPSRIVWEFGLMRKPNAVYLEQGWKKFVAVHSLQENDILVFTYVGQMSFDVLIFEAETSCERITSYFVEGFDVENEENKFGQSSSSDHVMKFVSDPIASLSHCSKLKKVAKRHAIEEREEKTDCLSQAAKKIKQTETLKPALLSAPALSSPKTAITDTGCFSDPDDMKASNYSGELKQVNQEPLLAELRKQKAVQLAYASARGIWSVNIMRQSYISQGFSMTLPTKWAKQYLPSNSQDIILRTNGQTWGVRFYRKGTGYALTGGWKKFALDNDLDEDDVCVFYLDTAAFGAVTLDVSIFRPKDVEIGETAVAEAVLVHANQSSAQAKRKGKLLVDEDCESL